MGYHSKVAIAVSAARADKFLRILHRHRLLSETTQDDDGNVLLLTSGKWYSGYPEIDEIDDFISGLDSDDYRFIRAGEDPEDIEQRGSLYDAFDLGVVVVIEAVPGREPTLPTDIELKDAAGGEE